MSPFADAYLAICGVPVQCRGRGHPRPELDLRRCLNYLVCCIALFDIALAHLHNSTSWLTAIKHSPDLMGKLINIPLSLHSLNSEAHQTFVHCDRLPPTACACARQLPPPCPACCLRAAHCARACARRTPELDYYTTPELTARLAE